MDISLLPPLPPSPDYTQPLSMYHITRARVPSFVDDDYVFVASQKQSTRSPDKSTTTEEENDECSFFSSLLDGSIFPSPQIDEIMRHVRKGVPEKLRSKLWLYLAQCSRENDDNDALPIADWSERFLSALEAPSVYEKLILRDLYHTFPKEDQFQRGSKASKTLYRVSRAYAAYDPTVGYCQGLSFIAGPLVLYTSTDEEAFALLVRVLNMYGLRSHYSVDMEGLHVRLSRFDCLLKDLLPDVHKHLQKEDIYCSMYATQWFMTLFSYRLPLPTVFRIFDLFFCEGITAVFRVALALMANSREAILGLRFDALLNYLNTTIFADFANFPERLVAASALVDIDEVPHCGPAVSRSSVSCISSKRIPPRETEVTFASLQAENIKLISRVRGLEQELTAVTKEHISLANEMVQMKLSKANRETSTAVPRKLYRLADSIGWRSQSTLSSQVTPWFSLLAKNQISSPSLLSKSSSHPQKNHTGNRARESPDLVAQCNLSEMLSLQLREMKNKLVECTEKLSASEAERLRLEKKLAEQNK